MSKFFLVRSVEWAWEKGKKGGKNWERGKGLSNNAYISMKPGISFFNK